MPQPELPPKCCGRCENHTTYGQVMWGGYLRIKCHWAGPIPTSYQPVTVMLLQHDGQNCPVFEPKEQTDAR